MRHSPSRRSGFTLVELLVVITIIGMLMAMIMPATTQVMEAFRIRTCQQNLRSLGTALQNYASSKNALPPGLASCVSPDRQWITGGVSAGALCQGPNWQLAIMQEMGETAMAENVMRCLQSNDPDDFCANTCEDVTRPKWGSVGTQTPRTLLCPSAPEAFEPLMGGDEAWGLSGQSKGNYAANFGADTFEEAITRFDDSRDEANRKRSLQGPFRVETVERPGADVLNNSRPYDRMLMGAWKAGMQRGRPLSAIRQSRTVMLSEVVAYNSGADGRGVWTNVSMGASIFTAKTPPNAQGRTRADYYDHIQLCDTQIPAGDPYGMKCQLVRDRNNQVWAAARSAHPGGVNVLFVDGSVEFRADSIDIYLWQEMASVGGRN